MKETPMLHLGCQKCSYRAIHPKDLRRHETQMHDQNLFPEVYGCQKCEFSTQDKEKLDKHIALQHSQQSRYFYRQKVSKFNNKENSNSCDYTTRNTGNLREHKSIHARQAAQKPKFSGPPTQNKSSNFDCRECGENFVYEDEHNLHREYFHASLNESKQQ